MDTKQQLIQNELDVKCMLLKQLLNNEEACERYIKQSHVSNRLEVQKSYMYKDIRGFDRYIK